MQKSKIMLVGAAGRMGERILRLSENEDSIDIAFCVEHKGNRAIGSDVGEFFGMKKNGVLFKELTKEDVLACDLILDFSFHTQFGTILKLAGETKTPLVSGTTGLSETDRDAMARVAETIPLLYATNMSLGVNILFATLKKLSKMTTDFDAEIVEMHHSMKKDAPSGTAVTLGEIIAEERGADFKDVATFGRSGITGEREKGTIGFHALRGGSVTGEHTVIFESDEERIELAHKAHTRNTFAKGAIVAAKWLLHKNEPGLFSMSDVLNLD